MRKGLVRQAFFALFLMIVMLLAGCAAVHNAVTAVENVLCNPTDEQRAEADAAIQFISTGAAFIGPLAEVPITGAQATAILTDVKKGVCVTLSNLQAALAYVDGLTTALGDPKYAKKLRGVVVSPDLHALRAAVQ